MLESAKIQRRQSEVREQLASLAANENLTDEQRSQIDSLDREYRDNEARFRAALIAEDTERREAEEDLEGRSEKEWSTLLGSFELRQVAAYLSQDGGALTGPTAEIVQEMRGRGDYRGVPVPLEALEQRAGETVASGTPNPLITQPIVDRLFADSAFTRMGGSVISIAQGGIEWPVVTSSVSAGWQATETGGVAGPTTFATTDKPLQPDYTLGVQMKITRKALKQSGTALEQAIRRDMGNAIRVELDRAAFLGAGSSGEPAGVIAGGNTTYGITETAVDATVTYATFRAALVRFMLANAISSPAQVRVLVRPEVWDILEQQRTGDGGTMWEWDRLTAAVMAQGITLTSNALAAPAGSPEASTALLTTTTGGVAPMYLGIWGGVDVIRDPYSDAASGGLRLTGLLTTDVTVARPAQLEILTGLQGISG